MKRILSCFLAAMLLCTSALAETVTVEGTVVSTETVAVLAPAAGTIDKVLVRSGDAVNAGDEVATLYAQTVYAQQSGTVRLFGSVGESVDTLTDRYGAVLYIEPDCQYTLSCTTSNAYNSIETTIVHPGETVYLRGAANRNRNGMGIVTSVSGSSYTIEVVESTLFVDEENVYIYRDSGFLAETRIGTGKVYLEDPIAYANASTATDTDTATETISSILVADGAHVNAGDALYQTVESSAYSTTMRNEVVGTVAAVDVAPGDAVEQGTVIAEIYPDSAKRLELKVEESDLRYLPVGGEVSIEFVSGVHAQGRVERISGISYESEDEDDDEDDDDVYFNVYVTFETNQEISYGMTAKVKSTEAND